MLRSVNRTVSSGHVSLAAHSRLSRRTDRQDSDVRRLDVSNRDCIPDPLSIDARDLRQAGVEERHGHERRIPSSR